MSSAAPAPRTRRPGADLRLLVPLRPQGPIEVLDRATHVLRTRMGDMLTVSAVVQIPTWLLLAVLLRDDWAAGAGDNVAWFWLAIVPDPVTLGLLVDDATQASTLTIVLARALPSIGLAAIGAACGVLVHDWAHGRPTGAAEALTRVGRRAHLLLALWAIVHAIEIVTCIGTVLGPLVFGVAAPLFAMEEIGPWRTVQRCWRLALPRFWTMCISVPVATLVSTLVGGAIGAIGLLLVTAITGGWIDAGGTAATAMAAALPHLVLDPLLATCMALLALDLKIQVEGYDLEVELAEAERGPMGEPSGRRRVLAGAALGALLVVVQPPVGAAAAPVVLADQEPPDDVQLPVNPATDPDRARETADEILQGDEYQAPDTRDRTVLERIREWIGDRLPDVDGDGVEGGANIVSYVVLAAVLLGAVGALTYVLVGTRRSRRAPDDDPDTDIDLTPLRTTDEWDAEAERCAAAGDHRGAVRARFRALTTALARRGVVADTPGRTAGELREDVAEQAPALIAPFGAVADLFEQVWYGDRPAGEDASRAARDLARSALDAAPRRAPRVDDDGQDG